MRDLGFPVRLEMQGLSGLEDIFVNILRFQVKT
jgi:hypothetical protein